MKRYRPGNVEASTCDYVLVYDLKALLKKLSIGTQAEHPESEEGDHCTCDDCHWRQGAEFILEKLKHEILGTEGES